MKYQENSFPHNNLSLDNSIGRQRHPEIMNALFSGQSEETDLSHTIKAMICEDVVLPCHVEPPGDYSLASVEWGRPDLMPRFVYVWYNQKEYLSDQNKAYRGRTSLFHDKLKDGDVSLKLSNVRHSDNGKYRCYSPRDETEYFVNIHLKIRNLGGLDKSSGGVMLDCSSAGWYPEPEVFWLDGEGSIMSAGPSETIKGPDGLYTVSSSVTVEKRHNNNITSSHTKEFSQGLIFVSLKHNFYFTLLLLSAEMKKLKEKENEEQQQLLKVVKQNLAEKKSSLEEEIKKRIEDKRSIDQEIEALMKMSEELKEQKKHLTDQREEAEKMLEENKKKLKAVDEVENQSGNKKEKKAQQHLKLKGIMTESKHQLLDRIKSHQQIELMTQKLMNRTSDEVTKLKERKQELEKHVEELQKQLREMKT
uniref:Ig-like domain-containing protein n=1 Tax=Fundulus heteroclitus TaxID=8078 RepID=A0A3Q2P1L1_FUNHE